jgi:SdrD B-like domain
MMKSYQIFALSALLTMTVVGVSAQTITGTVFLDVNANGIKDATEVGIGGATITAYNATGMAFGPYTATSSGSYATAALAAGTYRLEFAPPTGYFATPKGTGSNTTVQFVAAGSTTASLGIAYPSDYCQSPVNLELPCYEAGGGNVAAWLSAATHPAIASFPSTAAPTTVPAVTKNVGYGSVGSTWGAAYKRDAGRMFFSNVFKRHSDLGEFARPDASGTQIADGIYMVNHVSHGLAGTYAGGFRLQGVNGIDLGSVARSYKTTAITATAAADDHKLSTVNRQNRDLAAFSKVGKIGIGDIHISEDLKYLWAVNLNQRNLIKIDVSDPALIPTTGATPAASLVTVLPIDYSVCGTVVGTLRPWAITLWHGRGYVGVVNDAMGGAAADLKAFVLSFDPATGGSWVKEFEMSLDFNREQSAWPTSQNTALRSGKWRPWIDTWTYPTLSEEFSYPQALLANIEFTPNGSMVLGFMDRAGLQFDYQELSPISANTKLLSVDAAGDVVFVCKSSGAYIVEGSAGCLIDTDPGTPSPATATDGPKNVGEFFYQDHANSGTTAHMEEAFGALAMLLGPQQVVTSGFDVVTEQFNQGVDFYSTVTGKQTSAYQITPNNINKGVGLGEPEPL